MRFVIPIAVHNAVVDHGGQQRWNSYLVSQVLSHGMDPASFFDVQREGDDIVVSQHTETDNEADTIQGVA